MMLNELNTSSHNGYKFKYLKVGRTDTGVAIYQIQIFNNEGVNLTRLYKNLVGSYDKSNDLIKITTSSIESVICYLIESIY